MKSPCSCRSVAIAFQLAVTLTLSLIGLQTSIATIVALNPDTATYESHPAVATTPDGSTWIAWHCYDKGSDDVTVRRVSAEGSIGKAQLIGGNETTHGSPSVVATSADRALVVWSVKNDGRWSVVLREWDNGRWLKRRRLSDPKHDAIHPAVINYNEQAIAVWSEHVGDNFRIRGRVAEGGEPQTFDVSEESVNAYRPTLVKHDEELWAFWDQYRKPSYAVCGRRLLPTLGDIEQVSPEGDYCLTPVALSYSTGLHVAWLRKIDVMGGPGVVSQWHTLHAAVRADNKWQHVGTANGKTEAAELTQGLMAQISPQPIATGGYLGSRVRPMLQSVDDRVWLLWERKSDHRGSTPKVPGDLVGRPIGDDGKWQDPVVLHHGHVDYHVVHTEHDNDASITVVASKLPRLAKRTYEQFTVSVTDAKPFAQDTWDGWNPVKLPIESELTPRREVAIDGKTYKLYWGDLHCHSNLSADAEGEQDELNHYARDRAGLDVVVFTNNDFYNMPLTQYEYEVGNLFAARHSVDGKFISLPGYEWTSRIPGVSTAALSDPGNWLPPYRNRSYANHRSVIYPPSGGPLIHFTEVGNDIAKLDEAVAEADGITLSQHPSFKLSGHKVEVGLELTSGWSNYIAKNPTLFHSSLDQAAKPGGTRLGFVANGDSHRRAPGLSGALTGIYAEELSADAVLDALRKRRCFATSGSQISLDARANDAFMGEEVASNDGVVALSLHAIGTRDIISAVLVRDGKEIHRAEFERHHEVKCEFIDKDVPTGAHWYYWRVSQDVSAPVLPGNLMAAHGHLAWSSPHWVVVE